MKPLVSAVIPNYNYAQYVGEAVASALDQTYENLEVIVVDDGSRDDSLKVLEVFGDRIKVIAQQNAGVSVARNAGVAASSGKYVAFLDSDDAWLPRKIERQVACFESDPQLGLVHVGVVDVDCDGVGREEHISGLNGSVPDKLLLFNSDGILGGGSGLMLPRRVFDEVGGFDERLTTSADWDICYQVASRYPVGFINEVLLRYRYHDSNMHGNIERMEADTMIAWAKAFDTDDDRIRKLKRRSYGNLHKVLAGSYLHAGERSGFLRNLAKSLWYRPSYISYYLKLASGRK